jgi:hypothetical protein
VAKAVSTQVKGGYAAIAVDEDEGELADLA